MKTILVGRELAKRRREAGLSQAQVAARMGTTQGAVSRIETGRVVPGIDVVDRYARAVGTVLPVYFGASDAPSPEERRQRVVRVLGSDPFNPWDRDPTPAEERSLLADGLTRERFQG
jgi:transcriptional regulator with XRE-family HTH domain